MFREAQPAQPPEPAAIADIDKKMKVIDEIINNISESSDREKNKDISELKILWFPIITTWNNRNVEGEASLHKFLKSIKVQLDELCKHLYILQQTSVLQHLDSKFFWAKLAFNTKSNTSKQAQTILTNIAGRGFVITGGREFKGNQEESRKSKGVTIYQLGTLQRGENSLLSMLDKIITDQSEPVSRPRNNLSSSG